LFLLLIYNHRFKTLPILHFSLSTVPPGFAPDTLWALRRARPGVRRSFSPFEERTVWTFPLFF
jgi:hypothetical protein